MAKIIGLIPPQRFEIIRDRIGEIIAEELTHQYALGGLTFPNVYVERCVTFGGTELPAINITLAKGDYDGKTQRQTNGTYTYNIDIYTASSFTDDARGDYLAAQSLQRYLGMIRAILENPLYRCLDYAPPFNCSTDVISFDIQGPDNLQPNTDTLGTACARLLFIVKVSETVELITAPMLAQSITSVKLALTEKGYMYLVRTLAEQKIFEEQFEPPFE